MTPTTSVEGLRGSLDHSRMTRGQIAAVVLAVLIAGLDGYDLQSMAFVAPVVSKAWHIDKATLGLALASSLFGVAGGSLVLSPLADVIGRRPAVLGGILLVTIGSLLSALSSAVWELATSRAVTGLGIGLLVSLTIAIAMEFANARIRAFAVATTTVGLALGAMTGGLIAAAVLKTHDWPWVFAGGAVAGAVVLVLAAIGLPESPSFLIESQPAGALARLNRVLRRLGRSPLVELPPRPERRRAPYRALFAPGMSGTTIRLAIVYMLVVIASYYLISWLPQLVADAGFSPSTASLVSVTATLIGVPSGLIFGALAASIGPMRLASAAMIGFGLSLAALGFAPPALTPLLIAASACGFFLSASTAVFYVSVAASFPPSIRVSGIGLVLGSGRLLSGAGPYLAGLLFAAGWARSAVSLVFAASACAGGLLLLAGRRR